MRIHIISIQKQEVGCMQQHMKKMGGGGWGGGFTMLTLQETHIKCNFGKINTS